MTVPILSGPERASLAAGKQKSAAMVTSRWELHRNTGIPCVAGWRAGCDTIRMPLETALGRSLALVVHPHAAWRVLRPRGRVILVGAYFLAGYASALTVLLSAR